jgi:hypothetical protein
MKQILWFAVALILFQSADNVAMQKTAFDIGLLNEPARQAFASLMAAEVFAIGPVGFAAQTSETEKAFRVLIADPHAVAAFHQLADDARPAGQAYGLLGLYLKDRAAFEPVASRIRDASPEQQVQVMSGCVIMPEGMSSVLGRFGFYAIKFNPDGKKHDPQ